MRILVVIPHPDDEVLGVGGTILRHVEEKDEVYLYYMTKGSEKDYSPQVIMEKREEVKEAARIMGAKEIFFGEFIAAEMNTLPLNEVIRKLDRVVHLVQPEVIYLPHGGDLHNDHKIINYCGLVVSRPLPGKSIKKVLVYETISETEWGDQYNQKFVANFYVDISPHLEKKLEALSAYRTELRDYPHPRSLPSVRIKSQQRGSEVSLPAAEAFMLVRGIVTSKQNDSTREMEFGEIG